MDPSKTALILVGYQNDYFGQNGLLRQVVEESSKVTNVIQNTVKLIQQLPGACSIISTPIHFTPTYEELVEPIGILKTIKELGAFQAGKFGSQTIPELHPFKTRIVEIPGKRGLNAFACTSLDLVLRQRDIHHVILAGTITSICIDSTGRFAHQLGYRVSILSDCTSARTVFEQEFYCKNIFPVYADVMPHTQLLNNLKVAA